MVAILPNLNLVSIKPGAEDVKLSGYETILDRFVVTVVKIAELGVTGLCYISTSEDLHKGFSPKHLTDDKDKS